MILQPYVSIIFVRNKYRRWGCRRCHHRRRRCRCHHRRRRRRCHHRRLDATRVE